MSAVPTIHLDSRDLELLRIALFDHRGMWSRMVSEHPGNRQASKTHEEVNDLYRRLKQYAAEVAAWEKEQKSDG